MTKGWRCVHHVKRWLQETQWSRSAAPHEVFHGPYDVPCSGECCTARQLQELFGEQYDVSQLPKEGGWYQSDFEPDLEAWQRTKRVVPSLLL